MLTNKWRIKGPKGGVVLSHETFEVTNYSLGKPAKVTQDINLDYESFKNKHGLCMRQPTYGAKRMSLEGDISVKLFKNKEDELCKIQEASDKIRRAFTLPYNSGCAEPFKLIREDYCGNEFFAYGYPETDYDCDLDMDFCILYFSGSFILFPEYYGECKEVKCNRVNYFCGLPVGGPIMTGVKTENYKRKTIFKQECRSIVDRKLYYEKLVESGVEKCELIFDGNFGSSVYIQVTGTIEDLGIHNVSNGTGIQTTGSTTNLLLEPSESGTNLFENCGNSNGKIISGGEITLDCGINEILITGCTEGDVEICFQYFDTYV